MRELLDNNLKLKNAIEDVKLQIHIVKLMKSGQRATGLIDRCEADLTDHFQNVTCKVNMNNEKSKERSFEIMAKQEAKQENRSRPATSGARLKSNKEPIHIPTVDFDPDGVREVVHTDYSGRPDLERIHRERSDKFYHHKIDTLMKMMSDRTKQRAKSAPSSRPKATPHYTIDNLPETILEDKQMTRNDAEFELKKMRASAMIKKNTVMLYGEELETDGRVQGKGGGSAGGRNNKRPGSALSRSLRPESALSRSKRPESALSRSSSSLGGRGLNSRTRSAANSQERLFSNTDRSSRQSVSRGPSRSESRSSLAAFGAKISSYRQQDDDSDMSSLSDSEDDQPVHRRSIPADYEQAYYNDLGVKLKDFQDRRYPSRSLNPNSAIQKPFPDLFDVKLTQSYNRFCKKAARVKTVEQSRQDLEDVIANSLVNDGKDPWDAGYVYKQAWGSAPPI